jgi:hypothetical protein
MPAAIGPSPYANPNSPASSLSNIGIQGLDPNLGNFYYNGLPEAGFWNYLQQMGLTGTDPTARFDQGRYQNAYGGYLAAAGRDPSLGFYDYLQGGGFNPRGDFAGQSPQQRNDFTSQTMTPKARWSVAG